MLSPLPPWELRSLIERSAEAWLEFCYSASDDALEAVLGAYFAIDGGEARTGITLAQYSAAVRAAVCRLRSTGTYTRCRATVERGRSTVGRGY
jgi:hypothetical protein